MLVKTTLILKIAFSPRSFTRVLLWLFL